MTTIKNHPAVVTACLLILAGLHVAAASITTSVPSLASLLGDKPDAWGLYASAAGATAVVAGFSGVLVVFAMTSNRVFSKMRLRGGETLEANWISTVASSLGATLLSIAAAAAALGGHGEVGAWSFEVAVLIGAHASLRLLWLLGSLITAVRKQDKADERDRQSLDFEEIVNKSLNH